MEPAETSEDDDAANLMTERRLAELQKPDPMPIAANGQLEHAPDDVNFNGNVKTPEVEPPSEPKPRKREHAGGRPPTVKSQAESALQESRALANVEAAALPFADGPYFRLPVDLTFEQWEGVAKYARVLDKNLNWYIGDLLLYADVRGKEWEEKAIPMLDTLGFSTSQMIRVKHVARRFWANPFAPGAPEARRQLY
jgi:hypothetical protein